MTRDEVTVVSHPEIAIPPSVHGTGDVFMAAITAALLAGQPLAEAARDAARQVTEALARTRELGWEELAVEWRCGPRALKGARAAREPAWAARPQGTMDRPTRNCESSRRL